MIGLSKRERPRQKSVNPPRRLGDDEVSKLVARARPSTRDLIAFYAFTGVRQSEGLGVTWADIDLDEGAAFAYIGN